MNVANASTLPRRLRGSANSALLFRTLATLRTDIPLFEDVEELRWNGPTPAFAALGRAAGRGDGGNVPGCGWTREPQKQVSCVAFLAMTRRRVDNRGAAVRIAGFVRHG